MKVDPQILIVDDEVNVRRVLSAMLEQAGYRTSRAASGEEALELVRSLDPELVLTDLKMTGMDGLELLSRLRSDFPEIPVILLTAHGTVQTAVEAMKLGAHDFLTKPFDKAQVLEVLAKALSEARSRRVEFQGPLADGAPCGILGQSAGMEELRRLIRKVASSPTTILISGETGTGKELVADALHSLSQRSGPVVKINCAALPETLVEAELFGHEEGSFTGATRARPGRFELADGGTLFLDEVGEMPAASQGKLLRVLQDGEVHRIGSTRPRRVDARLIAATNRDLASDVAAGRFRQDLFFRLRVVEIHVPPLRERLEDIKLLVEFFLDKHARRLSRSRPRVTSGALAELTRRPWPGNVRELENAVERALLLSSGADLTGEDFGLQTTATDSSAAVPGIHPSAKMAGEEAQRRVVLAVLEATRGNVTHAAARLGLSRRGLQLKLKHLGLRSKS